LALVGLAPGEAARLTVPAERAYGTPDPGRVRRWPRRWFAEHETLQPGKTVRVTDSRRRRVRVLQVNSKAVVVDANHPWAGQALEMVVELVSIQASDGRGTDQDPDT
jgi:FKBP-type peptidyl-prolyl cis-trans isomerase 2